MSIREAIRILMLSPIYFEMSPTERRDLVKEYCRTAKDIRSTSN
ncbi:MAG: hypothetical protein OEM02_00925 [Desulfobulbaceae bacterium]|nr:hypothetical protein [Desulfobulbaceae bacterium]